MVKLDVLSVMAAPYSPGTFVATLLLSGDEVQPYVNQLHDGIISVSPSPTTDGLKLVLTFLPYERDELAPMLTGEELAQETPGADGRGIDNNIDYSNLE